MDLDGKNDTIQFKLKEVNSGNPDQRYTKSSLVKDIAGKLGKVRLRPSELKSKEKEEVAIPSNLHFYQMHNSLEANQFS